MHPSRRRPRVTSVDRRRGPPSAMRSSTRLVQLAARGAAELPRRRQRRPRAHPHGASTSTGADPSLPSQRLLPLRPARDLRPPAVGIGAARSPVSSPAARRRARPALGRTPSLARLAGPLVDGRWWHAVAAVAAPALLHLRREPRARRHRHRARHRGLAVYAREAATRAASPRLGIVFASGLLFGVSGLFRYHTALLAIGLLTWAVLRASRRGPLVLAAVLGLVLGFLPQVIVNVLGGFGPFATDSGFTMYQSVVDINWHATSGSTRATTRVRSPSSPGSPLEFAGSYLESLQRFAVPVIVVAAAAAARPAQQRGRVAFSLLRSHARPTPSSCRRATRPADSCPSCRWPAVAVAVLAARAFDLTRRTSRRRGSAPWAIVRDPRVVTVGAALRWPSDVATADARLGSERYRAATEAGVAATGLVERCAADPDERLQPVPDGAPGHEPRQDRRLVQHQPQRPHPPPGRRPHARSSAFYCDAQRRGCASSCGPRARCRASTPTWRRPSTGSGGPRCCGPDPRSPGTPRRSSCRAPTSALRRSGDEPACKPDSVVSRG